MRRAIMLCCAALVFIAVTAPSFAGGCGTATAPERAAAWAEAIASFRAEHRGLTDDQARWLDAAESLISGDGELAVTFRDARRILDAADALFTRNELGSLFSRADSTQRWLVEVGLVAAPYCGCWTIGAACQVNGGPTGVCQETQCQTWSGNGHYHIGLCGPAQPE